jgi:hypothetical protein
MSRHTSRAGGDGEAAGAGRSALAPAARPSTTRSIAAVLLDLIETADRCIAAPYVAWRERDHLEDLQAEIAILVARPAEGARLIDDREIMLGTCLHHIIDLAAGDWVTIAGALLPHVRQHAIKAVERQLTERPSP